MKTLSLCTGAAGIELGLSGLTTGEDLVAVAETDPHASKILAARFPGVSNLGDIRQPIRVDVGQYVERITAGIPCQGVSEGGVKRGADDPRWLGADFLRIVGVYLPDEVFLENVEGLAAPRHDLERNQILAGLSALGYSVRWGLMPACAIGAPMCRVRFYLLADRRGWAGRVTWMPGHDHSLPLLPGPRAGDGIRGAELKRAQRTGTGGTLADAVALGHVDADSWFPYLPTLTRWEKITSQPAPHPVESASTQSGVRLSPAFSEWMMGWPAGWVTDLVSRRHALTIAGNGVVPLAANRAYEVLKVAH